MAPVDPADVRLLVCEAAQPRKATSSVETIGSLRPGWLRQVVRDRLGIEPDVLTAGHAVTFSLPRELVELMESNRS